MDLVLDVEQAGSHDIDPHRMHQVISNLISNALAQMPDGGTLQIAATGSGIRVRDSGPGLPDPPESVFERFVKSSDSRGSGLGLSIARDLIEAHGGSLTARNASPAGAEFEIRLL